jgi:hypothetical protein
MNTELLLSDKRFRWISTMYYYVAGHAEHTITPFKTLADFLEMKVGDLWSGTEDARSSAKTRFCAELMEALHMRGFHIPEEEVHSCLSDAEMNNARMVHRLAGYGK